MNVHFIDTSVFVELLNVPGMNQFHEIYMQELQDIINRKETLILPYATIIETGNHIAQNGDGRQRRECASVFCEYIRKTVEGEAPWSYYGRQMTPEDLSIMCGQFCDFATEGEGFGDLSIIRAYEQFKEEIPVFHIRIWSNDTHLKMYDEIVPIKKRRNQK